MPGINDYRHITATKTTTATIGTTKTTPPHPHHHHCFVPMTAKSTNNQRLLGGLFN